MNVMNQLGTHQKDVLYVDQNKSATSRYNKYITKIYVNNYLIKYSMN
jgi:hypothetical protein